jgi:hypothetical protein
MENKCNHEYGPLNRNSYYKKEGEEGLGRFDDSISYRTLFCKWCGEVIEVISKDQRPKSKDND